MTTPAACYDLFGNMLTFRALPSQGAAYLLAECRTAPGAGAPTNWHPGDDEAFYVLSGRYLFTIDGQDKEVGPGTHLAIPRGAPHSFANIGADEASMLILNWPGTTHEAFFTTLGRPVAAGTSPVAPDGPPAAELRDMLHRQALACGVKLSL